MSASHRSRRQWRIFLWFSICAAVVSALFGYAVRPDPKSPPLTPFFIGALTSLIIATPLLLFELKGQRLPSCGA